MFTIEYQPDRIIVTSLDDTGQQPDVRMILTEKGTIVIHQVWPETDDLEEEEMIVVITHNQLMDLVTSLNREEGIYDVVSYRSA